MESQMKSLRIKIKELEDKCLNYLKENEILN